MRILYKNNIIPKQQVLIIGNKDDETIREDASSEYTYIKPKEIEKIENAIRNGKTSRVLLIGQLDE